MQTTAKMGTKSAAVAVFEMKLLSTKQMMQAIIRITNGFQLANGMLLMAFSASPVSFIALPKANPPATIQMTDQSISCKSLALITPVKANTAMGSMATVLAFTPNQSLPFTHKKMVRMKVTATTMVRQLCDTCPLISN